MNATKRIGTLSIVLSTMLSLGVFAQDTTTTIAKEYVADATKSTNDDGEEPGGNPIGGGDTTGLELDKNSTPSSVFVKSSGQELGYKFENAQSLKILNMSGQICHTQTLIGNNDFVGIAKLSAGVYVVHIQSNTGASIIQKIIKQ